MYKYIFLWPVTKTVGENVIKAEFLYIIEVKLLEIQIRVL